MKKPPSRSPENFRENKIGGALATGKDKKMAENALAFSAILSYTRVFRYSKVSLMSLVCCSPEISRSMM